jgi:hypothetical protein
MLSDAPEERPMKRAGPHDGRQWTTIATEDLGGIVGGYDVPAVCQQFNADYDYAMASQDPDAIRFASDEGAACLDAYAAQDASGGGADGGWVDE